MVFSAGSCHWFLTKEAKADFAAFRAFLKDNKLDGKWQCDPIRLDTEEVRKAFASHRADELHALARLVRIERFFGDHQSRLRSRPKMMRPILRDLAHCQVAQAILDAVLLHRVAVVARQAGRIEGEPDVAEVVLRYLLDAGGGERMDLIVGREVAERKFLRTEAERDEQRWHQAPH